MLKCLGCGKEFLYAAKRITVIPIGFENVDKLKEGQFTMSTSEATRYETTIESHICPFCASLEIAEVEKTQPAIEGIISVKICDADAKLKEGYEIKDTYASTVTLIKKTKETKP